MSTQLVLSGSIIAALGYFLLAAWLWLRESTYRHYHQTLLIIALLLTAISASAQFLYGANAFSGSPISYEMFDLARSTFCLMLIIQMFKQIAVRKNNDIDLNLMLTLANSTYVFTSLIILLMTNLLTFKFFAEASFTLYALLRLIISVLAVIVMEQVWRNTDEEQRRLIKCLLLSIVTFYAYDIFFYSYLLLFNKLHLEIYAARPLVHALTIPLFLIAMNRKKASLSSIYFSPEFVFGTTATIVITFYLLGISLGGYYIRLFGGSWGGILQILFLAAALIFMCAMLISSRAKRQLKHFVSQHILKYKHHYRSLWLDFTDCLAQATPNTIEENLVTAITDLFKSPHGALWLHANNQFKRSTHTGSHFFNEEEQIAETQIIIRHLTHANYFQPKPGEAPITAGTPLDHPNLWFIIPLKTQGQLIGFVELALPQHTHTQLDWEDKDLIEVVGHQAANTLAQFKTSEKLLQAEKFEAMNQVTAFLIHDIKTMISQLSLMTKNAEKHQSNPKFIKDMMKTTAHSVQKMSYMLNQLQASNQASNQAPAQDNDKNLLPIQNEARQNIQLNQLINHLVEEKKLRKPLIKTVGRMPKLMIGSIYDKLHTVLGHLFDNAQDACQDKGMIYLSVKTTENNVQFKVTDTGSGMSKDFIKQSLFKPFSSSKGLSGMGIGAFQCKEIIESLGGLLTVHSRETKGSSFTISIPNQYFEFETHC